MLPIRKLKKEYVKLEGREENRTVSSREAKENNREN